MPTSQISTLKNYLYCFYFVFFLSLFLSVSLTSLQFCTFFFFVSLSCSLFLYPRSTADREMKAPSLTSSEAGQTITLCVSPPAKNYALQITAFQPHSSIHFFLSILFKHFVTACVVNNQSVLVNLVHFCRPGMASTVDSALHTIQLTARVLLFFS